LERDLSLGVVRAVVAIAAFIPILSLAALLPGMSLRAGTIRADRDPSLYVNLGANPAYAPVGKMEVDVFQDGQPASARRRSSRPTGS